MGYTTNFEGVINFDRPLTVVEYRELERLANYDSRDDGYYKQFTDTPETMPDSYLQWQPTHNGLGLEWNGGEKFYDYVHWLRWLIKHYFKPRDIVLNGELRWQGEEIGDVGIINVADSKVTTKELKLEKTADNGKTIVKYEQYNPMLVEDEFGNEYICLNKYEAGKIKSLLRALKSSGINVNTGDWFSDVPLKIPTNWTDNETLKDFIRRLNE
jgi:hypothetical protein